MADWLPLLIPVTSFALCAGMLTFAEWRFARLKHVASFGPLIDAIEDELAWLEHTELAGRVRVVVLPVEDLGRTLVDGEVRRVAARSSIERAWRPWGSRRYLIEVVNGSVGCVSALLKWELKQRVIPHHEGKGWGPAWIPSYGRTDV